MSIVFEHTIDLPQTPHDVFAFLDDFKKVPLWLKRCEGVAKYGQGPNREGDKLRYAYFEGGRHRIMDGVIIAHEPDSRLAYRYFDKLMQVFIEFRLEPTDAGTRIHHRVEIVPHYWLAKLLAPLFKLRLPKQTKEAMEDMRRMLAAGG